MKNIESILISVLLVSTILWGMILVLPDGANAELRYVGENSTYDNLADALNDSSEGDIIVLDEGTHNGSFESDISGIVIRGNSSRDTVLVLNGTHTSILDGNNLIFKDMTLKNGTLMMRGNSVNVSNLIIDSAGSILRMENSTNSNLKNITVRNMTGTGLYINNCTSLKVEQLYCSGEGGEIVRVDDSGSITFDQAIQELNGSSTGFMIEAANGVLIRGLFTLGSDSANRGVEFRNSSNLMISDTSMDVMGVGISLISSHDIDIKDLVSYPAGNGSRGIYSDTSYNISLDGISQTIEHSSHGIMTFLTGNLEYHNSTVIMKGEGTGMEFEGSYNSSIHDVSLHGDGDRCTGIVFNGSFNDSVTDLDWTGPGSSSTFCSIQDSNTVSINETTVTLGGDSAAGIVQFEESLHLWLHDLDIRASGTDSTGIITDGARDSMIHNNSLMISGVSANGMILDGFNITTWNNIFTISGENTLGMGISGEMIYLNSDRLYPIGQGSVGLEGVDLVTTWIQGTRIQSSGTDAISMSVSGLAGTYWMRDLNLTGDDDSGIQFSFNDPGGVITLEDSTFTTDSLEPAGYFTGLRGEIEGSAFSGDGLGFVVDSTDHLEFTLSDIMGSIPLRVTSSDVIIDTCDLGTEAQSIEAMGGSMVRTLDTAVNGVSIDQSSSVLVSNRINIRVEDRFSEPIPGVDMMITRNGHEIYASQYFNSTDPDPATDLNGEIGPIILDHMLYEGEPAPEMIENNVTVYLLGTSGVEWNEVHPVDTSAPGTVTLESPDIDLPGTPEGLEAVPLDTREGILLKWTPNDDDTIEYRIFALDMEDMSTWNLVDTVEHPTASWTSGDLGPSTRGIYRITAWDGTFSSGESGIATAVTLDLTPPPPVQEISLVSVDQTSITISWTYPSSDEIETFDIFMNVSVGQGMKNIATVGSDVRSYTITGLSWGTTYSFRIRVTDISGNPSNMSSVFEANTADLVLTASLQAFYEAEGPLSGLPVFNGTASLISFNGTVLTTGKLDSLGTISFASLSPDEIYTIHVAPDDDHIGEYNLTDGYIPMVSDPFQLSIDMTDIFINMTLPYYSLPKRGSIEVEVTYGDGPRSGPVFMATVDLLRDDDTVIEQKQTDAEGKVRFLIDEIPFRGRFHVMAPEGISGSVEEKKTGYLSQTTNFFNLEGTDPDQTFQVDLFHYVHTPPPDDLLIEEHRPMGGDIALDAPIIVRFNLPVDTDSVIRNLRITPALAGLEFSWDEDNKNLTITHDGFLPDVEYTVRIQWGAMSIQNTTFPAEYDSNVWSFRTEQETDGEDEGGTEGISDQVLFAILIGIIIVIIIIGFYIWTSRNRGEGLDDDDLYALSDQDYYDEEEDYPEDDEFLDDEEEYYDDEFPEDEELIDEYPEDEELIDEYPEDEEFIEDEDEEPIEEEEIPDEEEEEMLEGDIEVEDEETVEEEEIPEDENAIEDVEKGEEETQKQDKPKKKKKKLKKKRRK